MLSSLAPWQHVLLLHDVFVALSCACGQILPLLTPETVKQQPPASISQQLAPLLNNLAQSATETDNEIVRLIRSDVQSSLGPVPASVREARIEPALERIKTGALQTMVDSRTRVEADGAEAWARSVKTVKPEPDESVIVKSEPDA